jgi:hypothetical protein
MSVLFLDFELNTIRITSNRSSNNSTSDKKLTPMKRPASPPIFDTKSAISVLADS